MTSAGKTSPDLMAPLSLSSDDWVCELTRPVTSLPGCHEAPIPLRGLALDETSTHSVPRCPRWRCAPVPWLLRVLPRDRSHGITRELGETWKLGLHFRVPLGQNLPFF